MEKIKFEKYFSKKNLNFRKNIFWDFVQLKCHLKSIFQKSILNDISIEKNIKICFFENCDFFLKIFFKFDFLHDKKQIDIFFGYLYRCKISCSFGLWGFQSDPGTANHSLEPGTMLVQKVAFFCTKCGLRTLLGSQLGGSSVHQSPCQTMRFISAESRIGWLVPSLKIAQL